MRLPTTGCRTAPGSSKRRLRLAGVEKRAASAPVKIELNLKVSFKNSVHSLSMVCQSRAAESNRRSMPRVSAISASHSIQLQVLRIFWSRQPAGWRSNPQCLKEMNCIGPQLDLIQLTSSRRAYRSSTRLTLITGRWLQSLNVSLMRSLGLKHCWLRLIRYSYCPIKVVCWVMPRSFSMPMRSLDNRTSSDFL